MIRMKRSFSFQEMSPNKVGQSRVVTDATAPKNKNNVCRLKQSSPLPSYMNVFLHQSFTSYGGMSFSTQSFTSYIQVGMSFFPS